MNRCKFFSLVGILSIVNLFSLAFVNVVYLQVSQTKEDQSRLKELCSLISDELKFCIDKQKIIVTSGSSVVLNLSIVNMSLQEMDVSKYDGGNYSFKVTNEKGEVILTKFEQKIKNGLMSDEDERDFIHSLTRSHRSVSLQPNEIYNEKIVLSDIYNFNDVGKYYVEIARKTRISSQDELIETSLGQIEIEVKGEND